MASYYSYYLWVIKWSTPTLYGIGNKPCEACSMVARCFMQAKHACVYGG